MQQANQTEHPKPKTTQQLSEEELKELKLIWKRGADELIRITKPISSFEITERNKLIIEGLFWWFFNDPRSCYDLNKGILLKGGKGTGKTTLVKSFQKLFKALQQSFAFSTAQTISLDYAMNGDVDFWLREKVMAIDEVGREEKAKYFGNGLSVIGYILHERYSIWQSKGIATIATTNLDSSDIESLYGETIRDRCKEMFNHIILDGESRR